MNSKVEEMYKEIKQAGMARGFKVSLDTRNTNEVGKSMGAKVNPIATTVGKVVARGDGGWEGLMKGVFRAKRLK